MMGRAMPGSQRGKDRTMSDWLHNLPLFWMTLVIFGFTYLVAAAIYLIVRWLAVGDRARSFKAVTPGVLSPLGVIIGLFVVFIAAQVWGDTDRANTAVNREASALRSIIIMASASRANPRRECARWSVATSKKPPLGNGR